MLLPWHEETRISLKDLYQPIQEDIHDFYRQMIALRHRYPVLIYGDYQPIDLKEDHFAYGRADQQQIIIVDCNLSSHPVKALQVPPQAQCLLQTADSSQELSAYEARVYLIPK